MSLTDQYRAAQDPNVTQQVQMGALVQALAVLDEPGDTANHAARQALALRVLAGTISAQQLALVILAHDEALVTEPLPPPDQTVLDALAARWDHLAAALAPA